MTDFVLIHGTTQDASSWKHVSEILNRKGHRAHAVQLMGSETATAADYAETIAQQVGTLRGRPVVVAHSGSGLLLPDAARRLDARHQVWLAAMIPSPSGTPFIEELRDSAHDIFNPEWIGQDPTRDAAAAMYFLFHDCPWERARWALGSLRRFLPLHPYTHRVALARDIPSTCIVCSRDRTLRPEWSRTAATKRLAIAPTMIDAGHCPHASSPDTVARILLDAAAEPRT